MKTKTILFFVLVFILIQPVTSTDVIFSISEPSNDISTVFTLVPTSLSHYRGSGGSSLPAPIQDDVPIHEEVNTTSVPTILPTVIPSQIPTTMPQEEVGINQTSPENDINNILLAVCFITISLVFFFSYAYVIGKRAIKREQKRDNKK